MEVHGQLAHDRAHHPHTGDGVLFPGWSVGVGRLVLPAGHHPRLVRWPTGTASAHRTRPGAHSARTGRLATALDQRPAEGDRERAVLLGTDELPGCHAPGQVAGSRAGQDHERHLPADGGLRLRGLAVRGGHRGAGHLPSVPGASAQATLEHRRRRSQPLGQVQDPGAGLDRGHHGVRSGLALAVRIHHHAADPHRLGAGHRLRHHVDLPTPAAAAPLAQATSCDYNSFRRATSSTAFHMHVGASYIYG